MKKILFSVVLAFSFFLTGCEEKGDDSVKKNSNLQEGAGIQEVEEDTLDEFEYEADSVETDDDEDI